MLRTLTEFILPNRRAPRECEACGKPFHCGASIKGCWCVEIKLSDETRKRLREQYTNCLCRQCLEQAANGVDTVPRA